MISKNHRQNHNFQIIYFLVGSCHTPDAAYALLQDLREEREMAIENYHVSKIKESARMIRANRLCESMDEADKLDGQAELTEIANASARGKVLYRAACDEIEFIDECIEKISLNRKYADLSDSESCQAMQQEEWLLELIHRSENFLLTTGTIPTDHFATMRMHPEFKTKILPKIQEVRSLIQSSGDICLILENGTNLLGM